METAVSNPPVMAFQRKSTVSRFRKQAVRAKWTQYRVGRVMTGPQSVTGEPVTLKII